MEENKKEDTFQTVKNPGQYNNYFNNSQKSKKEGGNFSRNVVLPFFSGIVGCSLVLGTCLGVPSIKSKIFNNTFVNTSASSSSKVWAYAGFPTQNTNPKAITIVQNIL